MVDSWVVSWAGVSSFGEVHDTMVFVFVAGLALCQCLKRLRPILGQAQLFSNLYPEGGRPQIGPTP